ncbi:T9SS type A sorting domain-containing protein [candidate division KSB1 bacterium]|nr:T9SS type A sorting domain-containing protein [candidate division KSB1 bacterium]
MKRLLITGIVFMLCTVNLSAKTWKIMPIGDSITKGVGDDDDYGYRDDLSDLLTQRGISHTFVGPDGTNYPGFFQGGAEIQEFLRGGVKALTADIINTFQPDLIIVHLGTNNFDMIAAPYSDDRGITVNSTASGHLANLVKHIYSLSPNTRLILSKIPPRSGAEAFVQSFNAEIDQMFFDNPPGFVQSKLTIANTVIANNNIGSDGIHPTPYGYAKLANELGRLIEGLNSPETWPPSSIDWLNLADIDGSASLQWRAVGDDGNAGRANMYELRYATYPLTQSNFSNGTLYSLSQPQKPPAVEEATINDLIPGTMYYFGIRAYDELNNKSSISTASLEIQPPPGNEFCDDFCIDRSGTIWSLHPDYLINEATCELINTSTISGWNALAIYSDGAYNSQVRSFKTSLTWSSSASTVPPNGGVFTTGLAVMLSSDEYETAEGYVITLRQGNVYLWEWKYGRLTELDRHAIPVDYVPPPQSTFEVRYKYNFQKKHTFSVFVNENWLGELYDEDMRQGLPGSERLYSGVMQFGNSPNNIDQFCIEVPPLDPDSMLIYAGNAQRGRITEPLANPLTVQVVDVNKIPVPNVIVDFDQISGGAFLSTDSIEQKFNGNIWLEGESGEFSGPFVEGTAAEASGKKYVYVPRVSDYYGVGTMTYKTYIPKSGSYKLYVRGQGPDNSANSIFVKFPGLDSLRMDFEPEDVGWFWYEFKPRQFRLDKGFVEFSIINREPGSLVDRLLLTLNPSPPDAGTGGSNQRDIFSNITSESGLAYTKVTFSEQAGQVQVKAFAPSVPNNNDITFTVYGDAGAPESMVASSPAVIQGVAGKPLDQPFSVQLTDAYNNRCAGVAVDFSVISGDGHFGGDQVITVSSDENGVASATLNLGYGSESTLVQATVQDLPELQGIQFQGLAGVGPAEMVLLSSAEVNGQVATPLAEPVRIKILDTDGAAFPDFPVIFTVEQGDGKINGNTLSFIDSTNQDGIVSVEWTLGETAGTNNNQLTVSSEVPLTNSPVHIFGSATAADPSQIILVSGNSQSQSAGRPFKDSLVVKIADRYGNARQGHSVTFTREQGDGLFDGQSEVTKVSRANGRAAVLYTAGRTVGTNRIRVQALPALDGPKYFNLSVTAVQASEIQITAGENQEGIVGHSLANPFQVRLLDPFGEPVPDLAVLFKTLQGNGRFTNGLDSITVSTDSQGYASASFVLGTKGGYLYNHIRVSIADPTVIPVIVKATGLAGTAHSLLADSDTTFFGRCGEKEITLRVLVKDQYNNPKPNHTVTFQTFGTGLFNNNASTVRINTNQNGIAAAAFTMGNNSTTPEQVLAVSTVGNTNSPLSGSPITFTGYFEPGDPDILNILHGNNQTGIIETTLDDSLVVQVLDACGVPVPNQRIQFQVTAGGGMFGNSQMYSPITDAQGRAFVFWTLGSFAGNLNQQVTVKMPDVESIDPQQIYATGLAGPADKLSAVGDTLWQNKAVNSSVLARARVTDNRDNPIQGHPIKFTVLQGGGHVQQQNTVTVATNKQGIAEINWTMGTAPTTNRLMAESDLNGVALTHSPVYFRSETRSALAYYIERISAKQDTGIINDLLSNPIRIRITDQFNNPVANYPVFFNLIQGNGATFQTAVPADTATIRTDVLGTAEIFLKLGPNAGTYTVQAKSPLGNLVSKDLGSPGPIVLTFEALPTEAHKLIVTSAKQLTDRVRSHVMVKARVVDQNGNPIQYHPVYFEVLDQQSRLSTGDDSTIVSSRQSDIEGNVSIDWILGTLAGPNVNQLQISSYKSTESHLQDSPVIVTASLEPGPPNIVGSSVSAESPVAADGLATSHVDITLADMFGNAISNQSIGISVIPSQGVEITQPENTDLNGRTTAVLTSTASGEKTVQVSVPGQPEFTMSTVVTFTSGEADDLVIFSGNNQIGNRGTVLDSALVAMVVDKNNNPVADIPIQFKVGSGGGKFMTNEATSLDTRTDSAGLARAYYILGEQVNQANYVEARIALPELNKSIVFRCDALANTAKDLVIYGSSAFTGTVGDTLSDSLAVRVTDSAGKPVYGTQVIFEPQAEGAIILNSGNISTDYNGVARAAYRLGTQLGNQEIRAQVDGIPKQLSFSVTGTANIATQLKLFSGNSQTTIVNKPLTQPLIARTLDRFNNPVANVPVVFKVIEGQGGQFSPGDTVLSRNNGAVQVSFTPGTQAGEYVIQAQADGINGQEPVIFTCKAVADAAFRIVKVAGDNQSMTAGRSLVYPIVVKVVDRYDNPVSGFTVHFFSSSGFNSSALTDQRGLATCRWVLKSQPGGDTLFAGVGLQNQVAFYATAVQNNYPEFLSMVKDTTIYYNREFSYPLSIRDLDGDKVSLQMMEYTVSGAQFDPENATFTWTPQAEQKGGPYWFVFKAEDTQGGQAIDSLGITVSGESAPIFWSLTPNRPEISLERPAETPFRVVVVDPDPDDMDNLVFSWFVDSQLKAKGKNLTEFIFNSGEYSSGSHTITVQVTDGKLTTTHAWTATVTSVELALFEAVAVPYEGIILQWQTHSQKNNLGFNVWRGWHENGKFERLNEQLIANTESGDYTFKDPHAKTGMKIWYKLQDVSKDGTDSFHGPVMAQSAVPETFQILQNFPNPFNPETKIRFQLPKDLDTRIAVYNLQGQLVRMLIKATITAGYHEILWDGRDEQGKRVASGVYYYRIEAGPHDEMRKMVLIK